MENGLTFIFDSNELRNLLGNNSTHVIIVASLKSGTIGGKAAAVMQITADAYVESVLPPGVRHMSKVNNGAVFGCPVPPCRVEGEGEVTLDCVNETNALLDSYRTNNFSAGFNFQ